MANTRAEVFRGTARVPAMTDPSPEGPSGRRATRVPTPVTWLSALLIVVLLAWASVAWINSMLGPSGCQQRTVLDVAAAPGIAGAVADFAAGYQRSGAAGCVNVQVAARDSAAMAEALANPPPGAQPHVWLPESTFWLGRAQAMGAFALPTTGTPVATSPVVLAVTEPVASQFGWPARPVGWPALLLAGDRRVAVGLPDPATDPVGVSALVGIQQVTAGRKRAEAVQTAVLRRLSGNTVARAADLYQRLPEAGAGRRALHAFVTTEQALLRHNARPVGADLVAAYAAPNVPTLDFPYVVVPGTGADQLAGAAGLLGALLADEGRRALAAAGFRAPDGSPPAAVVDSGAGGATDGAPAPPEPGERTRSDVVPPVPLPDGDELVRVLSAWTGVQLSARLLGVIDVSGSMAEDVPGGRTRLAATIRAAQEGVGLMLDTTEVGIWLFSTRLDGDLDYRVLHQPRPLGEARAELVSRLGRVQVRPAGGTGLYDTTLAAYREARRSWVPGRINVVLIATDGRNDDPDSITRAQLLAELTELHDPRRSLPILFIGIGGGVNPEEMKQIAAATGGRVFLTREPSGIRDIFFTALSDLGCQPPSCRK
jgi:hypothetical protein